MIVVLFHDKIIKFQRVEFCLVRPTERTGKQLTHKKYHPEIETTDSKENGVRLFAVVPRDRTRGNEHQLEHRRFLLAVRKRVSTVKVIEHWSSLSRGLH